MLPPALTGSGLSVLVTARSARVWTVVVAVSLSLVDVGSVVVVEALAVFEMTVPAATLAATLTTRVNVCDAPAARLVLVQLTLPPAPTAGVVQLKLAPAPWVSETNVVPAGRVSVRLTDWASDGPLLVMPIV